MCFHIVRTEEGYQFVPKTGLSFRDTYVDIRKFTLPEWREHVGLAEALVKSGKGGLIQGTAENTAREIFDSLLSTRK